MTYDYKCPVHGPFSVSRSMTDYRKIEPCPKCKADSPRHFAGQKVAIHGGPTTGARG